MSATDPLPQLGQGSRGWRETFGVSKVSRNRKTVPLANGSAPLVFLRDSNGTPLVLNAMDQISTSVAS